MKENLLPLVHWGLRHTVGSVNWNCCSTESWKVQHFIHWNALQVEVEAEADAEVRILIYELIDE